MIARWALAAGVALVTAGAAMSPAFPHSGGSTGFASIAIGRESIRYSLTLWPSALPPEVAQELLLARAGQAASRDRLLGVIHDKVTLVVEGRRCKAGHSIRSRSIRRSYTAWVKAAGGGAGAPVQRRVNGRSEPRRGQEEDVWV